MTLANDPKPNDLKARALADTLAWCRAVLQPGAIHELRFFAPGLGKWAHLTQAYSALYNDPDQLAHAAHAASWERDGRLGRDAASAVYVTPNPANPVLRARGFGRTARGRDASPLSDADILGRTCLLIDADPVRPRDISASDEEVRAAVAVCDAIRDHLDGLGWPAPIRVASGNGAHLVYRIELGCEDEDQETIRHVLAALSVRFGTELIKIDPSVCNPSRVWKVPGTWTKKGWSDEDGDPANGLPPRPHRVAALLDAPDGWYGRPVAPELIEALAQESRDADEAARAAARPSSPSANSYESGGSEEIREEMLTDLSWVEEALDAISADVRRNDWLMVGRALQILLGDCALGLWDRWSAGGAHYKGASDCEYNWTRLPGADEDASGACKILCGLAKQGGWSWGAWWRLKHPPAQRIERPPLYGSPTPPEQDQEDDHGEPRAQAAGNTPPPPAIALAEDIPVGEPPVEIIGEEVGAITSAIEHQLSACGPEGQPVAPRVIDGILHVWRPETGRWSPFDSPAVSRALKGWEGRVIVGWSKPRGDDPPEPRFYKGKKATRQIFGELLTRSTWDGDPPARVLALNGSAIRVDLQRREVVFEDLRPEHRAVHGYDFDLDQMSGARAPRWREYLLGLFQPAPAGAPDPEDGDAPVVEPPELRVDYLRRWLACAVFGVACEAQLPAIILQGDEGTGKSTLLKIIEGIMPPGSSASVKPTLWGNEQARALLSGKLLNLVGELGDEPITSHDMLKAIVFGDPVTAKVPYHPMYSFRPQAAHIWCANALPSVPGADNAVWRRFQPLRITGRQWRVGDGADPDFAGSLLRTELPGILNDLVRAMFEMCVDWRDGREGYVRGLPVLASSDDEMAAWKLRADAVARWVSECTDYDASLPAYQSPKVRRLYHEYCEWCRGSSSTGGTGYQPGTEDTFTRRLANHFTIKERARYAHAVGAVLRSSAPI